MNIHLFFFIPVFSLSCAICLKHVERGGTQRQFLQEANFPLQMQESVLKVKMNP